MSYDGLHNHCWRAACERHSFESDDSWYNRHITYHLLMLQALKREDVTYTLSRGIRRQDVIEEHETHLLDAMKGLFSKQ